MARFFAGQPIKKVSGNRGIGTTGRYVCDEPCPDGHFDCWVACDIPWTGQLGFVNPPSKVAFCASFQWEPIQPSGHQPSEYATVRDLMDAMKQANPDEVVA